ncbi:aldo/keto reductase [Emticicia sp. 21SJ11W-3]|uniref:aldo/keto reductase n=1 Tax=Emticicia sp. 21SJ11W-3 TaxID=2916755 RepID=UPI00209CB78C|nr:aldo/keto reductase [Emticicia sp. 21SJ11W-3]UTA70063.1 aldo/keto reductase [Emticicia sp. 21SJ11W-3]
MQTKQLMISLSNGVQMPLLGLGVYDMYKKEAVQAVLYALETGYRLIDTASMYRNETEIGNAVNQSGINRNELFITTKVNNDEQGYEKTLRAFDASLQKMNLDYVDLYMVHWPIKLTRKFTWKALERLYHEGRVKAIGVANYLIPFLDELSIEATVMPAVNQVEFSPYLFQEELLNYCREKNIQLQAYSPLVRGQRMNDPKLLSVAQKYNKTPAQIILRWAMQLGISTIPKSANPERLKENFDVFDFEINQEDISFICSFNENLRIVDDPMALL